MSIMSETTHHPPPDWYPCVGDPVGVLRYWDGRQWTSQTHDTRYPAPVGGGLNPMNPPHIVVHQDRGKPVNHVLHAVLSVLTFGLWLPVWLIVAIAKN